DRLSHVARRKTIANAIESRSVPIYTLLQRIIKGIIRPVAQNQHYSFKAVHGSLLAGEYIERCDSLRLDFFDACIRKNLHTWSRKSREHRATIRVRKRSAQRLEHSTDGHIASLTRHVLRGKRYFVITVRAIDNHHTFAERLSPQDIHLRADVR